MTTDRARAAAKLCNYLHVFVQPYPEWVQGRALRMTRPFEERTGGRLLCGKIYMYILRTGGEEAPPFSPTLQLKVETWNIMHARTPKVFVQGVMLHFCLLRLAQPPPSRLQGLLGPC